MSKHRVTRRQAKHGLPQCVTQSDRWREGEINAIAATRSRDCITQMDWSRLDYCGYRFRSLSERLWPQIDTTALLRVERS